MRVISIGLILVFFVCGSCKEDCLSPVCGLAPETGSCTETITKYYYDEADGKCKEFVWGGCSGMVPFDSFQECENACHCD